MKYRPSLFALSTLFILGVAVGYWGFGIRLMAEVVLISLVVLLPFLPFVAEYDRKKANGNGHDVHYTTMLFINLAEYGSAVSGLVLGIIAR